MAICCSHSHSHFRSHPKMFILVLFLFLFHTFFSGMSDLMSDRAALLGLRSAVGGRTYLWNSSEQSPCQWAGVRCENNRVTALHLPGVSLYGQLPVGTIGNLTHLRTLSLRFNALSGPLPSDLASCVDLRNLYLQDNSFSGPLPDFFYSLQHIVRLNLAGNNFSGQISTRFNNLTRLRTLYLENNQFSGSIPELNLPNLDLDQFNVSFNQLNGSVPNSLRSMPTSSFQGNSLCGPPLHSCSINGTTPTPSVAGAGEIIRPNGNSKNHLSGGAVAGIVIGSVLGFLLILLILFLLCRKKSSKKASSVNVATLKPPEAQVPGESSGYTEVKEKEKGEIAGDGEGDKKLVFFGNAKSVFDLEDLLRASAEVLGKGTFGTAYKAVLDAGIVVVVKRLKDVTISEREFKDKIEPVGAMEHANLVPPRAYYYSREEKLLVYDYMTMGSLSAVLHGNRGAGRTPLNWEIRTSIALGTARGIEYIHSQGPNISHGNIKSSNILLTKSYEARLSDFGLAHLVGTSSAPNRVAGYRAPEVTDPRKVSQKADVYSFGILLLELLTGKAPTHALLNEEGVDLPRWVQSIVKEEWTSEVFDHDLFQSHNAEEEMVQLLQLAIDCAAQYPDKRPSISEVTGWIEEIRQSSLKGDQDPQSDIVKETV